MNYRPITDIWILARPKVKYYGAYGIKISGVGECYQHPTTPNHTLAVGGRARMADRYSSNGGVS